MTKPITYSPLPNPGGLTPEQWAKEVRALKSRGWLQDPENLIWPDDPNDPRNIDRRRRDGACLRCCWRAPCRLAKRCRHLMPLAIREHRHKIWPDSWKLRSETDTEEPVFTKPERLPKFKVLNWVKLTGAPKPPTSELTEVTEWEGNGG